MNSLSHTIIPFMKRKAKILCKIANKTEEYTKELSVCWRNAHKVGNLDLADLPKLSKRGESKKNVKPSLFVYT